MNVLPASDIALATRFVTYDAAATIADQVAADDPTWNYGVARIVTPEAFMPVQYVIAVLDEEDVFLGYL
jgi:hypothetical protein